MKEFQIGHRRLGGTNPCFVIAEAGVNHNGSLEMAYQLIDAAVAAGADAVKFQTFKAEQLASPTARKAMYQAQSTGAHESQLEMLKRLELPYDAFRALQAYCTERGILFMSTPFDEESADFLADLVEVFKVPSGEITNLPFVEQIARHRKPIILSTGMANLGEVEQAVDTVLQTGNDSLALLHCVSHYPAEPRDVNLRAMQTLAVAFGLPTGYSDHTPGTEVALAAVAMGAKVIEKHFTLDNTLPGPDHQASLTPPMLAEMIRCIRNVELALGDGRKRPAASEADTMAAARKSLVAMQDIPAGTVLTREMVGMQRPGTGLPPSFLPVVVGRRVRADIAAGMVLELGMFL